MNNTMIMSRRNLLKRTIYGGAACFLPLNLFSQPNFSELQETLNGILQLYNPDQEWLQKPFRLDLSNGSWACISNTRVMVGSRHPHVHALPMPPAEKLTKIQLVAETALNLPKQGSISTTILRQIQQHDDLTIPIDGSDVEITLIEFNQKIAIGAIHWNSIDWKDLETSRRLGAVADVDVDQDTLQVALKYAPAIADLHLSGQHPVYENQVGLMLKTPNWFLIQAHTTS